jgi:hypothetical protein
MSVYGDPRLPARFWSKVRETPGCWEWTGAKHPAGYGQLTVNKVTVYVHRVAYEALVGPIPDGLYIDHLCRTRSCVRPNHLEAVKNGTNVLRGFGRGAINARKTHCAREGHPLSGDNLYVTRSGRRRCRTCIRANKRMRREQAHGQSE